MFEQELINAEIVLVLRRVRKIFPFIVRDERDATTAQKIDRGDILPGGLFGCSDELPVFPKE